MKRGFTLIELIVATALFVVVMVISITAVLNAIDANRKAQSMSIVINNLNLAVESMVRDIRTGSDYDGSCGAGSCIRFKDKEGRTVEYKYISATASIDKDYIVGSGGSEGRITGPDTELTGVSFDVGGDDSNDGPERVFIHIKGKAGNGKTMSEFNIQTLVTSRILDVAEII